MKKFIAEFYPTGSNQSTQKEQLEALDYHDAWDKFAELGKKMKGVFLNIKELD